MLIIVSQLLENRKENIINFIKKLNCPVYLESISNMREVEELNHLKIKCPDKFWNNAKKSGYTIDAVLKIGGTPTHRIWRDLEETNKHIKVMSISKHHFSGIPNAENIMTDIEYFLEKINFIKNNTNNKFVNQLLQLDNECYEKMMNLVKIYPLAEQSIFWYLSNKIKENSCLYLGNSLPIRHWDLAATYDNKNILIDASRGLNGIDGQISAFLGFAKEEYSENWGVFGDLTTLYDMAGFWMLQHRPYLKMNIVIINNKGGKIFNKILTGDASVLCQNIHNLNFEYLAKFWGLEYEQYGDARLITQFSKNRMIELIPDQVQTDLFSKEFLSIS